MSSSAICQRVTYIRSFNGVKEISFMLLDPYRMQALLLVFFHKRSDWGASSQVSEFSFAHGGEGGDVRDLVHDCNRDDHSGSRVRDCVYDYDPRYPPGADGRV
jgi:hypothetical protein